MDGVHDLGGTDGMGPIERGDDDPGPETYFHDEWEARVFALLPMTLGQGMYNLDEFRHTIERMRPTHYLDSPYYEHWLYAMEEALVENGVVTEEELQSRLDEVKSADDPDELVPEEENPELTNQMIGLIESGVSTMREPTEPAFESGDDVVVKNMHPDGHTRCPSYVRRSRGVVDEVRGTFVLPDAHAHGEGENPEPVYSVRFDSDELWGEGYAEENTTLYIDLWESYLESA